MNTIKKINLTPIKKDVFYSHLYPIYAKDFLFSPINYEQFARIIEKNFVLSSEQWEYVLEHWNFKENILTED